MAKHKDLADECLRAAARPAAMVLRRHMRELPILQSVVVLAPEATVRSLWRWGRRRPAARCASTSAVTQHDTPCTIRYEPPKLWTTNSMTPTEVRTSSAVISHIHTSRPCARVVWMWSA
jgi:hypothetical protein